MSEIIGLSIGALKERKVRSVLTVLMVMIGVALMTSLNGLGGGMENFIDEQLNMVAPNVLIITPSEIVFGFGPPQDKPALKLNSQTVKTIENTRGVKTAFPTVYSFATLKSGGEEQTAMVMGIDQHNVQYVAPKVELEYGTYVLPNDITGIVLGHNLAFPDDLDKPFAKNGQTISIEYTKVESQAGIDKVVVKKKSYQVKGIMKELGTQDFDNGAFLSLEAANALFEKGGYFDGIYAVTIGPEENDKVEERLRDIYGKNIGIISPKAMAEAIKDIMGTFGSFISGIAVVSMFVGGVGIVTTLYTSVVERIREIGLLKAIGYGNTTILSMFLIEGLIIGSIGGFLGLLSGMGGSYVLIRLMITGDPDAAGMTLNPYFKPQDIIQVFFLALFLSLLAGLYPAWRASKLSPIEALRKDQ